MPDAPQLIATGANWSIRQIGVCARFDIWSPDKRSAVSVPITGDARDSDLQSRALGFVADRLHRLPEVAEGYAGMAKYVASAHG